MFKVGCLDDDNETLLLLMNQLSSDYEPIRINLKVEIDALISGILAEKVDAIVVDYNFGKFPGIQYDGVDVINKVDDLFRYFPSFILTGYHERAEDAIVDVNKVYRRDQYFSDPSVLNQRIGKQINNLRKQVNHAEKELLELRSKSTPTLAEEERILELDEFIEAVSWNYSGSREIKKPAVMDKMNELIQRIHRLSEELGRL